MAATISRAVGKAGGAAPAASWPASFNALRVYRFFFLAVVLSILAPSARAEAAEAEAEFHSSRDLRECVCDGEFDATKDYFPVKAYPHFSRDWNVTYFNNYKLVYDKFAKRNIYLVQCGTPAPEGITEDDLVIDIPVQRISVDSTTMFHYVGMLGQAGLLAHYDSYTAYVTQPCLIYLAENGDITDATSDETNSVDVKFVSYAGNPNATFGDDEVVVSASHEPSVLGRTEWVEFFSLFFNREYAATQIADAISARYECTEKMIEDENANATKPTIIRGAVSTYNVDPEVACASYDAFLDQTFGSVLTCPHSECILFESANLDLVTKDFESGSMTTRQLGELINSTDIFILQGDQAGTYILDACKPFFQQFLDSLNPVKANNAYDVYKTVATSGTDYFGGFSAEPDVALLDVISLAYDIDHERRWFRRFDEDTVYVSSENCTDIDAPLFAEFREEACDSSSPVTEIGGIGTVKASDLCPDTGDDDDDGANSASQASTSIAMAVAAALVAARNN